MKVAVVTVNYNRPGDTVELINSISHSDLSQAALLVVDNGSTDGSVQILKKAFPKLKIIETGSNLGFAGGYNFGMAKALDEGSDFVLIINNDTIVPEVFLQPLLSILDSRQNVAAVAPKTYRGTPYDQKRVIWWVGGVVNLARGQVINVGAGEVDGGQFENVKTCDYLSGVAILFRSTALKEVGLFDPQFLHTGEDVDLSLRLRKKGYDLVCCPEAVLWHKVSRTGGGEDKPFHLYNLEKSRILLMRKWGFWQGLASFVKLFPLMLRRMGGVWWRTKNWRLWGSLIRGWHDGAHK